MTTALTAADVSVKERIIERAWRDPAFRQALVSNPTAALLQAFNIAISEDTKLVVIEETPERIILVIPPNPAVYASDPVSTDETW